MLVESGVWGKEGAGYKEISPFEQIDEIKILKLRKGHIIDSYEGKLYLC